MPTIVGILAFMTGMIKSNSLTPRATDFWGRASEKLSLARPRTSVFFPTTSKLRYVFQASKNQ